MNYRASLIHSTFLASALVAATAAHAQSASEASSSANAQAEVGGVGISDIVVTAQRRAENVQSVPISVAAFGGQALKERGITDVAAMANLTPSVQLTNSSQFFSSPSMLSGFIRGIGQDEFAINFEPGVGTYIDGVYLARAAGSNFDLMDVERIEILKGPQGTLFGRNTIGGAISVVTRDPAEKFGAQGTVTAGRFGRFDVGGIIDLPISDELTSSISFSSKHRDGWQERRTFPGSASFTVDTPRSFEHTRFTAYDSAGGIGEQSVRGKLKWQHGDLTLRLSADYMQMETSGTPTTLLGVRDFNALGPVPGNANLGPANANGSNPNIAGAYNLCIGTPAPVLAQLSTLPLFNGLAVDLSNLCGSARAGGRPPLGSVNADADLTNNRLPLDGRFITGSYDYNYATGINFSKGTNYGFNATIDYQLDFGGTIKSITAYRDLATSFGQDADGTPVVGFEGSFGIWSKQFSEELQLSGNAFNDRLKYLFGLYYFSETGREEENVDFPGGLIQIKLASRVNNKSYAAFTHLNYKLSDLISLTLGGRFTREDKQISVSQRDINLFYDKLGLGNILPFPVASDHTQFYPQGTFKQKFDNFVPRLGVELHPADDVMVYGSWSKGFKSGGWTTRIAGPTQTPLEFMPERVTTYELGLKSRFFDRKAQLNIALFQTDYSNMQIQVQRGISPEIENAGKAKIRGVEVEGVLAPTDWFRLNGSVGYIDAKYLFVNDPTGVISVSNRLPKVPKWSLNIGPEFTAHLSNGGRIVLRGDYTYKSTIALDSENTPLLFTGRQNTTNASIAYFDGSDRWSLSVGGTNIFNDRYLVNGVSQVNGGSGVIYGTPNRPAEWYSTLRFTF